MLTRRDLGKIRFSTASRAPKNEPGGDFCLGRLQRCFPSRSAFPSRFGPLRAAQHHTIPYEIRSQFLQFRYAQDSLVPGSAPLAWWRASMRGVWLLYGCSHIACSALPVTDLEKLPLPPVHTMFCLLRWYRPPGNFPWTAKIEIGTWIIGNPWKDALCCGRCGHTLKFLPRSYPELGVSLLMYFEVCAMASARAHPTFLLAPIRTDQATRQPRAVPPPLPLVGHGCQ